MGRRLLSGSGPARDTERGFTLVEVITAMAITITVMMANLYLFNTAQRNLAFSRSLTNATNLATNRIADFRAMTMAEIDAATPTVLPSPNPLNQRRGSDTASVDGLQFNRTWVVSAVDIEHDGIPDLTGEVVKIKVEVEWTLATKSHRVTMTTFSTGKT